MRYFIEISFNGKNYHGWQMQPNAVTVQEVLENALSTLLHGEIKVIGAGRTDAGVHARQLVAHFDYKELEDTIAIIFKLNSFLPKDVSVINLYRVNDDAHARFDAIERKYEYIITLNKNPFFEDFAYLIHQKPNVELMNQVAKTLLNYKDFQCFSRSKTDVKTYHCNIKEAFWKAHKSQLIFTISADRFLRNMVRSIVGTLLDVGLNKITPEMFQEIIKSKDRSKAGVSAPAKGLFLTKVIYSESINI